ncbi:HlyD family efflux transporter periplasmic adaptor subunit [Oleiharenicola sp. Vm1]|uniref:HlyD family efflux transporter periplasmic adaptor subunit n=1 Tax=Oleiharenicola sp. Vm1 TaxID=3398393 RepID=UPI0039F5A296
MSAAHPLPLPLAAHTVESLRAEHGRVPRAIYWLTLAGTVAALISLPLIEVDVSVSAPGVVRPATERVDLRLALGGRVARVLAHDNDRVAAGQPLLELATPDLDERLARNAALQREKQAVQALLDSLSTVRLVSSGVLYDVTGRRAVEPFSSLQAIGQEVEQLRAQLEAGRVGEAKARSELARATALADKGIATQRELDDARYALERVQAEARLAVEQMRTHWHDRRQETAAALADLASEQKRLEAERAQAVLRAPLAGTVQGIVGLGAGAIVGAGQVVGAISPDDRLVVETHVPPHEIGLVRPGQPVRLQIDAFPYTQWGLLDARVVAIAADASNAMGAGGALAFKVTIAPARSHLQLANGAVGRLGKGMTVSARFLTARRTLLQILYQDASVWLDPQNRAAASRP